MDDTDRLWTELRGVLERLNRLGHDLNVCITNVADVQGRIDAVTKRIEELEGLSCGERTPATLFQEKLVGVENAVYRQASEGQLHRAALLSLTNRVKHLEDYTNRVQGAAESFIEGNPGKWTCLRCKKELPNPLRDPMPFKGLCLECIEKQRQEREDAAAVFCSGCGAEYAPGDGGCFNCGDPVD